MNTRIFTVLEKIGLSEKEISLYISGLELGTQGMTKIAKRANLKRSTAYGIYESLEKKGFMSSYKRSSGMYYFSISPSRVFERVKQNALDVKSVISELDAIENINIKKPKIMYYEGLENYKRIIEESLQEKNSEILSYGNMQILFDILGFDYDEGYYVPKRKEKNISIKALVCDNLSKIPTGNNHSEHNREIRFFPKGFLMNSFVIIFGNKIVNIYVGENIYMTVSEADYLASDERKKFEIMWNSSS